MVLAVPRIGLESYLLEANRTLEELEQGISLSGIEAHAFAENLAVAATANGSPRLYALAARAWIALATQIGETPEHRTEANDRARAFQAAGLALAPADQYGWQRFSHTLATDNDWIAAAAAWQMAVRTGPFEPEIMPVKFEAGLALWRYMDLDQRRAFAELTETFLRTQPGSLAALVHRFGGEAIVRQALGARTAVAALDQALAAPRP
jgi:hypothetical protein